MNVLLDTCEFLWLVSGSPRLPSFTERAIRDPSNDVFLSVVSFWEIAIKHALGRLPLPQLPAIYFPAQRELHGVGVLNLDETAVSRLPHLPPLHKDPFDRMLI